MNIRNILTGAIALSTLATAAQADVEILITGATAFRAATITGIKAQFTTGGSYVFAHNVAAGGVTGADRVTFKGVFPGVAGTTTVRCSFSGSVEGIRAIALGGTHSPAFIQDTALANPGTDAGEAVNENALKTGDTLVQTAKFAFSDVRQSSTPVSASLNPASPKVGVIPFTMVVNEGTPSTFSNVSNQQFKALFSSGFQPLSMFTADNADSGTFVFATGRNDGSGTRTTYMAESGLGITALVNQYLATASTSTALTTIRLVPAANGTNASTVWGQDVDGNGGYNSGSALRTDMGKTSSAVTVLDAQNNDILGGPAQVYLATFLSISDARTAVIAGARIIGYNGSSLDSLNTSSTLSSTDKAKITEGQYSAWGFENLYYAGSLSTDENTVYTAVKSAINTSFAPSYLTGIPLSEMNVSRPDDGAPIAP